MNRRLQARVQRVSCCCRVWDSEKSLRQLNFTPREQMLCPNGDLTMLSPWILVERTCSRAVLGSRGKDLERARKFWSFMKVYLLRVVSSKQPTLGGFWRACCQGACTGTWSWCNNGMLLK
jgi:hypothetical protein